MACSDNATRSNREPAASFDTTRGPGSATVVATSLRDSSTLRIFVQGNESVPVAGRYTISDTAVEFHPRFPFDRGRNYVVTITNAGSISRTTIALPAPNIRVSTSITRILPNLSVLPENQLRLYIEFSAPMSREAGLPFIHLRNSSGDSIAAAFLPVDGNFWNGDRTRYTIFLDPGRVKRGILPNEQMGRPLRSGGRYSIHVDSTWRDSRGVPLVAPFVYSFRAGPSELNPILLKDWSVGTPKAGTRDSLLLRFPRPLDHGLLRRALGVENAHGENVAGEIAIGGGEREWHFTPAQPWSAGEYRVIVLAILEDLAGNRVNRAFEADRFDRADSTSTVPRFTLPVVIK